MERQLSKIDIVKFEESDYFNNEEEVYEDKIEKPPAEESNYVINKDRNDVKALIEVNSIIESDYMIKRDGKGVKSSMEVETIIESDYNIKKDDNQLQSLDEIKHEESNYALYEKAEQEKDQDKSEENIPQNKAVVKRNSSVRFKEDSEII
eukprot:UN29675